jgi:hypothetical protein
MSTIWLIRVICSHLVADFILQPGSWVDERRRLHFRSPRLYLHSLIAGLMALLLAGMAYWPYAVVILVTHFFIDSWKSFRPLKPVYFFIDQGLHVLVILGCWYAAFFDPSTVFQLLDKAAVNQRTWVIATAFLFLSFPAGIAIGQMTRRFSEGLPGGEGLANAGKWIGILERMLILIFMIQDQYGAIGLLITAKGLLRFSESDRQEEKTEYVLIGTLLSVLMAIVTGLVVKRLLQTI